MKQETIDKMQSLGPIGRRQQSDTVFALLTWLRTEWPEMTYEVGEYQVDGTNRTNVAAGFAGNNIQLVYVEHCNCFVVFSNRLTAIVATENGIMHGQPNIFLYPDQCFARTPQELVESLQWVLQKSADDFRSEHESMSWHEIQQVIDKALDKRDFAMLELIDPFIDKKE